MTNKPRSTFACTDPIEICRALVGLKDVDVLSFTRHGPVVELMVEKRTVQRSCPTCREPLRIKDRPVVIYTDLPVYGTPARLAWKKHRMTCSNTACQRQSWVTDDHRIAAKNCLLTTRCAKWATKQVGTGRTVSEVAKELSCDWHTVNDAVTTYGKALLGADHKRLNKTRALGLDETSFIKLSHHSHREFCTSVVDVEHHQLIDILPTRNVADIAGWINAQTKSWQGHIRYGSLDMSNVYSAVFNVMLPKATQVVDKFHAIKLANQALDEIRRRVQIEQLGHRGRKHDPLYKSRRLLLRGEEKLSSEAKERLESLLELGDPDGEIAFAYRAKEYLRDFYQLDNIDDARLALEELRVHCSKKAMSPEMQRFARTLGRWFEKLLNYHRVKISNGPTEALNNLIKRIKRIGFGFRNFENYRLRALLYAGKPNWRLLDSIVVK